MLECVIKDSQIFRKTLEALKEIVEEVNIEFNDDGLYVQAMDSSHCSLVSLNFENQGFDTYRCGEKTTIGLNLAALLKIIKCGDSNDQLHIEKDPNEALLKIKFESSDGGRRQEFSLNLITLEDESLNIPESEPEAKVEMTCGCFQKICRDMAQFGETIKIKVNEDNIIFQVVGTSTQAVTSFGSNSAANSDDSVSISCTESLELSFNIKFLNTFAKAAPVAEKVTLSLSEKSPLLVTFDLPDDIGSIKYYLAPKVDENDDD